MPNLSTLKLVQSKKPNQLAPVVIRRHKLSKKIWEQLQLVKATLEGRTYQITKYTSKRDPVSGLVSKVEAAKRVKQWWWTADTGKLYLNIRYGNKVLEIVKGKNAIEVSKLEELVGVLEQVKLCVETGELDQQIEQVCGAFKAGFKR